MLDVALCAPIRISPATVKLRRALEENKDILNHVIMAESLEWLWP